MDGDTQGATAIMVVPTTKLNRSSHSLAISQDEALSPESIGHLNIDAVKRLMLAAGAGRHGKRDALIIECSLFPVCGWANCYRLGR